VCGDSTIAAIITDTLPMTESQTDPCDAPLHPQAAEGLRLFNAGEYFEAHEALEEAWKDEEGEIRNLYRGILQIAVVYLHITRGNYNGAVKVHARSQRWLRGWATICRGIRVGELRENAEAVIKEVMRLGTDKIPEFDLLLLKPVRWEAGAGEQNQTRPADEAKAYICDRCGSEMVERNCKITCPNCGNRFDCSDLNIYFQ
jgi:uncharacterized protein